MARMITKYQLTKAAALQSIPMPRRARILHVYMDARGPVLSAELLVDADTKAFEVSHSRNFVVLSVGATVPEGAGYVGSCASQVGKTTQDFHVFEIGRH